MGAFCPVGIALNLSRQCRRAQRATFVRLCALFYVMTAVQGTRVCLFFSPFFALHVGCRFLVHRRREDATQQCAKTVCYRFCAQIGFHHRSDAGEDHDRHPFSRLPCVCLLNTHQNEKRKKFTMSVCGHVTLKFNERSLRAS